MLGRRRSLGRAGTRDAHSWLYPLVVHAVTGKRRGPEKAPVPPPLGTQPRIVVLPPFSPPPTPQLHRSDTDTQSLQLLSEPDALGTRQRPD